MDFLWTFVSNASWYNNENGKGKGQELDIALLHDEHVLRSIFTVSEVVADWHEVMIPQHIVQPSIARASEQLDPRCSMQTYHCPNQLH